MRKMFNLVGILVVISMLLSLLPLVQQAFASSSASDHIMGSVSPVDGGAQVSQSLKGQDYEHRYNEVLHPFSGATDSNDITFDFALEGSEASSASGMFLLEKFRVGSSPWSLAVADVNKDTYPDVVTANRDSDDVSVLLGNGDGSFATQTTYGAGTGPYSVALADLNNDTLVDIVTANLSSNNISVLLGIGDGSFAPQTTHAIGAYPLSVALADLNNDTYPDVVTANRDSSNVSVLLGNGDGSFATQTTYATGAGPFRVALADVNNDTFVDIVTANANSDCVSVLLGYGNGSFGAQATFAVGGGPISVALADLNDDTFADIVAGSEYDENVSVLLGNGDGSFAPQTTYSTGDGPISIALSDINRDGYLDVITANYFSDDVSVLLGDGDGAFAAQVTYVAGGATCMALADFDQDTFADIITADGDESVSVLMGKGDGSFSTHAAFKTSGCNQAAMGDVNNDGFADVVTVDWSWASVLLGNGDGSFAPRLRYAVGPNAYGLALADLNNDGFTDIVATDLNGRYVSVLLGYGDGTFAPQTTFWVGNFPRFVALADLNNDGFVDIVTSNQASNNISVLLGNGDGSFAPQSTFPAGVEPWHLALADLNKDSFIDIVVINLRNDHLLVFLGNGDGSFALPVIYTVVGCELVTLADTNSDTFIDIVTSNQRGSFGLSVLLGHGDGTFEPPDYFAAGYGGSSVALADLNNDGLLDIVTGGVAVLLGNGVGAFIPPVRFGGWGTSVFVTDLNDDQLLDLVTANLWNDLVCVLIQQMKLSGKILSPVRSGEIAVGDSLRFAGEAIGRAGLGPYEYRWDFGDSRTSPLKDPGLVRFDDAGGRTVSLDVSNRLGQHPPVPATRTLDVIADPGSLPDLTVTGLNVPADLEMNQPSEITYSVRNNGGGSLIGRSWQDAVYLSHDAYLDTGDQCLISVTVNPDLPPGGSYNNSLVVTLPTLVEGAYYLLLSVDDQWQVLELHQLNNEFAVATDVFIPQLSSGVPLADRFVASNKAHFYRINVPEGQNLLLKLDDVDNQGVNEIYLRLGALPTRGNYDYYAAATGSADQEILAPRIAPGTWYVLAYGAFIPGNGDFTILADISTMLKVAGVTPSRHSASSAAVLTLHGMGFDTTTTVALVDGDGILNTATSLSVDSYTQITATFDLTALALGMYAVRVSSPAGGASELTNAFEVLPAGEGRLETNLILPSGLTYQTIATIYVEYSNTGNVAIPAPLLLLTATQYGQEGAFLTLEEALLVAGFWTSAEPEGFSHSIQILASGATPGVLQPGESCRVPVYYAGWQQPWDLSYPPINFILGVLTPESTKPVDWASLKDDMRPVFVSTEAWEALWATFVDEVGPTWGNYVRMLGDNAAYLGSLGQQVVDVSQLLAFELQQADGLSPLRTLAGAVDAVVEAPCLSLVFLRTFAEPISARYELGPLGRGWSHNWQYSLVQADDGTVTVVGPGGSRRTFQPDSRYSGRYFSQPGDYATLTALGGGTFTLRERDGLLFAFSANGKLDYVEDTNGNRITCDYTGDLLTSLTHSSGPSLLFTYDATGQIDSVTDSVGRLTNFTYDAANEHLLSVEGYDGQVTSYSYITGQGVACEHALTEISYPGGTHRYFTYDAQGRLSGTSRDANAEAVAFSYEAGKVTATDALGYSSKFYFDHRGLLVKTEDALGNAIYMSFDDYSNLTSLTDPAGLSYTYNYDSRGNLVRSTDPLGYVTRFSYASAFNRLTTVTDAKSNVMSYRYDINGNLNSITYADGSIESWGYDSLGDATSWTNRRGNVTGYSYDASGRITGKTYADGSYVEYIYDSRGNLISTTDPTGITTFSYDASDYLIRVDYPGGQWLEFTYDAAGRRASSLDQTGHRLDYHYDSVGRLESLTNESSTEVVHYHYNAAGRIDRKTLGNGVYTTYNYDAASQLLHLMNYNADDSVLSRFDYTYDSRGRRLSMNTSYGLWTYEYDDLGQLTHAVLASTEPSIPNQDLIYVYDALGNRISTVENGVTTKYVANKMNQYTQVGDTTYIFDADGNLIEEQSPDGTTTYTYNDENRLVSVTDGSGIWQYVYDAQGNRVATTENGVTTNYIIDPIGLGNVLGEYDGMGNLTARYDYGLGLLSLTAAAGNVAYYTFDAIGSTSELVTNTGTLASNYAYNPFGTLLQGIETNPNTFQHVGEFGVMKEGNGLEFMRARDYRSTLGRFLVEDPLGMCDRSNRYVYCVNDPLGFLDPLGLDRQVWNGGHMWLTVDKYDESGRVTGQVMLDLAPQFVRGNPGADWRIGDPSTAVPDWWPRAEVLRISSDREADEALVAMWRDQQKANNVGWNPGYNCWLPVIQFARYGIEKPIPSATAADSNHLVPRPPRSCDPNAKMGLTGFGDGGFILPDRTFAYRIDFENEASATAPAQQVVITDRLDSELDWTTLQFTEIGFGDQFILVPSGAQHFETAVPVSYNGVNFEMHVVLDLDLASGMVTAHFYSIDPETGLPPTDDIGFLPPEDGTGRGMGHISYVIKPESGLSTGTEIRNIALISFDNQPDIATNQVDPHDPSQGTDLSKECLNTIDAGAPTSHVNELPSETNTTSFAVSWNGSDDVGGSGIANYDIYVSDDGGPFSIWLDHTALVEGDFIGESDHIYAFYSIARDNVGHVEEAPAVPDTVTTVTQGNSAPVAVDDFYTTDEDITLNEAAPGVLGNDTDPEENVLSVGTPRPVSGPSHGTLTLYAEGNFTYTPSANYNGPDSFTYKANDGALDSDPATVYITVNPVNDAPEVSNSLATQNVQYSDPITPVRITATDVDSSGQDLSATVAGLPAGIDLNPDTKNGASIPGYATWIVSGKVLDAPNTYHVTVTVTDDLGAGNSTEFDIVVGKEDAKATYTGALYAGTSSATSSKATVTLAATIQDITAVDPASDSNPGDIRNATVTFINRDSNTIIGTAPIGLVSDADTTTATATLNWSVDIGNSNSKSYNIGIIVNGFYTRNSSDDDTIVTVSKPLNNFITGGGYLVLASSSGLKAGDEGNKNNFGFSVKYSKGGSNLQGTMTVLVRRTESDGIHVYRIKGNVMTSLAANPVAGTATFNGKASIQDITDPLNPVSVDGNAALQVTMTDKGELGTNDTIGITIWNKKGGLWFCSNWNGTKTIEQSLAGGNLVVH